MITVYPSNGVIEGEPPFTEEMKVKTAANVIPGRLLIKDTNDDSVQVAGAAGKYVGWAGYEHTPGKYRPATRATAYVANDRIAVHSGSGFKIRALLVSGQNVVKGTPLIGVAAGKVSAATIPATVTPDAGAVTMTGSVAKPTLNVVGAVGDQGPIVGFADESVDASAGDLPIWVKSAI